MPAVYAQQEPDQKQGYFSFGVSMSDYKVPSFSKYTFGSSSSFGIQLSYWKPIIPHIDFSINLGMVRSNFPAGFIKDDSVGQLGVTLHTDALIHIKAFARDAGINPFITAGIGAGTFAYEKAAYVPLGAGVSLHLTPSSMLILQGQMRDVLSKSVTGNFMFYSVSFAHRISGDRPKKQKNHTGDAAKNTLASADTTKHDVAKALPKNAAGKDTSKTVTPHIADTATVTGNANIKQAVTQNTPADTDGDGIPDKLDKCPGVKGNAENDGCPFPPMQDDNLVAMAADSVTYRIYFDYDRSDLLSQDFQVLDRIVKMLQADKTLTINISGFADMQGTQARNMKVSSERANVTLDYFLSYHIPSARINMSYYGGQRPLDAVQQWRNRRVEITVSKKQ